MYHNKAACGKVPPRRLADRGPGVCEGGATAILEYARAGVSKNVIGAAGCEIETGTRFSFVSELTMSLTGRMKPAGKRVTDERC